MRSLPQNLEACLAQDSLEPVPDTINDVVNYLTIERLILETFFAKYNKLIAQIFSEIFSPEQVDVVDSNRVLTQRYYAVNAFAEEDGTWRQVDSSKPSYALRFDLVSDATRIVRSGAGTNPIVWVTVGLPFGGTFLALTDTPSVYAAHALKYVRVNSTPDALEFTDVVLLRRVNQAAIPTPNTGEGMIWRDSATGQVWLVYNDITSGTKSVELT